MATAPAPSRPAPPPQSLDQQRAAFAWQAVGTGCSSDYANLAKSAPALIMANGLMQTLAFFEAKGKEHHTKLSGDIRKWLADQGVIRSPDHRQVPDHRQAMDQLVKADVALYRRATAEALLLLRWVRQFAAAVEKTAT